VTPQEQKSDYLDEHLPYMLSQLIYDFKKLSQGIHFRDWNTSFQSFAVNARNLVAFLTNGDTGNFRAGDFIKDFKIRKGDIQGPMTKLDQQVFHLGKSRPREEAGKFDVSAAREVFDWIDKGMKEFVVALSPEDKKLWNARKADPEYDASSYLTLGPTGPGAPQSASSSIKTINATTGGVQYSDDAVSIENGKRK
jgi:hypothetical protein